MALPVLATLLQGCLSVGPGTIEQDRFDYGQTIAESWKMQVLLNVVRIRYADMPVFLDVSSVINQYSLEGTIGVNTPGWDKGVPVAPPAASIGGRWADRPTITYTPLTGEAFTRAILTPIPPATVMSLLEAGWSADFLFAIMVRAINGVHSGSRVALAAAAPDPEFAELVDALSAAQRGGGVNIRVEGKGSDGSTLLVLQKGPSEELHRRDSRIREILRLDPEATEFELVYAAAARNDHEVALLTRTMYEIMSEVAAGIDVPEEHVAAGEVLPTTELRSESGELPRPVTVRVAVTKPADAFVAVPYRGQWFWIDHGDRRSKAMFTLMMHLFSLAESGRAPAAPLLTVGAG